MSQTGSSGANKKASIEKVSAWEPMGRAFLSYLDGNRQEVIVNKSVFGSYEVPVSIYFRDVDELPEAERYALELCRGTILDIGGGSGCHSLILKEDGADVTAMDISPLNVEAMKRQGLQKVIRADIFDYQDQKFDTLLMLMNGIRLAGDLPGLERFLLHAHKLIRPGGQIIFDSTDMSVEIPDAAIKNKEEDYFGTVRYTMQWRKLEGRPFKWLYVAPVPLRMACKKTGWEMQIVFEDQDGHFLARLHPSA